MLPFVSLPMPVTWRDLLEELAPEFRRRSTHALFMALACGMILAGGSRTLAAAAGIARQWRRACWFFSHASWDIDDLGLAVGPPYREIPAPRRCADHGGVRRDVLCPVGKKVAQARWAYNGAAQGGKKIAFGNT
jgi:hypothetical protein